MWGGGSEPNWDAKVYIYSYKCMFCRYCPDGMSHISLNYNGEPPWLPKHIQCKVL